MSKATFATVIGCKDGTVIGKDEDGTVVVIGKVRNGTSVHTAVVAKAFIAALLHPHLELSGVRKGAAARLARSLVDAGCM